jgi:hypothetical protein
MKTVKKNIKFSISFGGILPSGFEMLNTRSYSFRENVLPEVILR